MPRVKIIKSFVHNLADSYLSTLNYLENDYSCGWLSKSAKESAATKIVLHVRENEISPSRVAHKDILLQSMRGLNDLFDRMLKSHGLEASYIPEITLEFTFPQTPDNCEVHLICNAFALDMHGKLHQGKAIEIKYGKLH